MLVFARVYVMRNCDCLAIDVAEMQETYILTEHVWLFLVHIPYFTLPVSSPCVPPLLYARTQCPVPLLMRLEELAPVTEVPDTDS